MSLKLIDHERNFMLEAVVQESRVVFVMTNGAEHQHRWMMRVDHTAAREQLAAFLTGIPDFALVARNASIKELKERVWLLEEIIQELLIYATPFNTKQAALCKDGYTSELLPMLTRLGPVQVADRIAEIRAQARPNSGALTADPAMGAITADPAMGAISAPGVAISGTTKDET